MIVRYEMVVFICMASMGLCASLAEGQERGIADNPEEKLSKHVDTHGYPKEPLKLGPITFIERCEFMLDALVYVNEHWRDTWPNGKPPNRVLSWVKILKSEPVLNRLVEYRNEEHDLPNGDRLTLPLEPIRLESRARRIHEVVLGYVGGVIGGSGVSGVGGGYGAAAEGGMVMYKQPSDSRGSWTPGAGGGVESQREDFVHGDLRIRSSEGAFDIFLDNDDELHYRIPKTLIQGLSAVPFEGETPFAEDVSAQWQEPNRKEFRKLLSAVYSFGHAGEQDRVLETIMDVVPQKEVMGLIGFAETCIQSGVYEGGVELTEALASVKSEVMSISTQRAGQGKSTIQPWQLLKGVDANEPQLSSLKRSFMPYAFERSEAEARGYYYLLTPTEHSAIGGLQYLGVDSGVAPGTNRLIFKSLQEGFEKQYVIDPAMIQALELDATVQGLDEN